MHAAHHACVSGLGPAAQLDTRHFALGHDCSTCHQTCHCGIRGPAWSMDDAQDLLRPPLSPSPSSSTVTHRHTPHHTQLRLFAFFRSIFSTSQQYTVILAITFQISEQAKCFLNIKCELEPIQALFSSKIFCKIDTVAFSFVFDKYCSIID